MPLPININDLFTGTIVEWERVECKTGWNPEDVLHTICAFANDFHNWGGGYIVIGIAEDDGRPVLPPVGLTPAKIDAIQKELLNLAHRIQPMYYPVIEPVVVSGKQVLVIWVPGGQNRPYKVPVSLAKGEKVFGYYVRMGASSVVAKGAIEQELLQLAAAIPFDDRINHHATMNDLQLRLIQANLQEIGSSLFEASGDIEFSQLCEQMRIVDGPREILRPKNVGLLFFNERPERFFDTAWIDVVYLFDPTGTQLQEKRFTGPLDAQLRSALTYIRDQFIYERVVKHPGRAESERFFSYPYAAIEEALANAVYHRGYNEREPIEVRITPSELQIISYPGPDASITLDALHIGRIAARRYRNRRIGEFLKELRLTEGRGTGVPRMLQAMQSNGSPPPRFETDAHRSYFSVTLPIHPQMGPTPWQSAAAAATRTDIDELLSIPRVREILTYCLDAHTRSEILIHLGLKDIKAIRERYLVPLLRVGLLAYIYPETPRVRNQAYRTTEVGRDELSKYS